MTTAVAERISQVDVERLIEAAAQAPSPDNNQPWQFAEREGTLLVYHDASRALPSDAGGMFSAIALGAAIENICIAASQVGLRARVRYVELSEHELQRSPQAHVATIGFEQDDHRDPLGPFIKTRCTCRKPFAVQPVPEDDLRQLETACGEVSPCRVFWITDRPCIKTMARLVARADLLRFQHRAFHDELFRQLRFTMAEAEETRDGLDLRTLELPFGAGTALRWLKPWRRMKMVHRLGLGWMLTRPSAQLVLRSGALGLLTLPERTPQRCLEGGRALERIWLTATSRGLSLHPLGSLPIFLAHLERDGASPLAEKSRPLLETLRDELRTVVPEMGARRLLMLFRLGEAPGPVVCSLRRATQDLQAPKTEVSDDTP